MEKRFYKKSADDPDDETFYSHCLQFYVTMIYEITLEKHKLGLGIFTMQEVEKRNKDFNNTLRRFCNRKGSILPENIRRLYDLFYYGQNA